jgi:hypothetical protein
LISQSKRCNEQQDSDASPDWPPETQLQTDSKDGWRRSSHDIVSLGDAVNHSCNVADFAMQRLQKIASAGATAARRRQHECKLLGPIPDGSAARCREFSSLNRLPLIQRRTKTGDTH